MDLRYLAFDKGPQLQIEYGRGVTAVTTGCILRVARRNNITDGLVKKK